MGHGKQTTTRVGSYDDGIAILRAFAAFGSAITRHSWAILMLDDEGFFTDERFNTEPCYGGLRKYGERSNNRPNDPWPEDLREYEFPDGTPVALAVGGNSYHGFGSDVRKWNQLMEFSTGEKSPWCSLMKQVELIEDDKGYKSGLLFLDLSIDPTLLVNYLMQRRNFVGMLEMYDWMREWYPDVDEGISLFIAGNISPFNGHPEHLCRSNNLYAGGYRYVTGTPLDVSYGLFNVGTDYNRPNVEYLFAEEGYATLDWREREKLNILKPILDSCTLHNIGKSVYSPKGYSADELIPKIIQSMEKYIS